jgi:hypothetical protein
MGEETRMVWMEGKKAEAADVAQPPSYDDGHNSEETSEGGEEEEEVIHKPSFPDLYTLDMTLPFSDYSPISEVCKYVDV